MTSITNPSHFHLAGVDAAIPKDIEFIPAGQGLKVLCLQGGETYPFQEIAKPIYIEILNKYNSDRGAKTFIQSMRKASGLPYNTSEQVEIYVFYMWGAIDGEPDIKNGQLQPSENYITGKKCPSLKFDHKHIKINGERLKSRDLKIILMFALDLPNKAIADELGISIKTLEGYLTNLYRKTGVYTRTGLVATSYQHKILA